MSCEPLDDARAGTRLDALMGFGDTDCLDPSGLTLPRLVLVPAASEERTRASIAFSRSTSLDDRLRGRVLQEDAMPRPDLLARPGDDVLALADGCPVWVRRSPDSVTTTVSATCPEELRTGEFLRDLASPGRVMGLLPIVHFLREVVKDRAWTPPPGRAAFVVDDPNLHWRNYGYLRYPELIRHARAFGYHVVMAMVPLDAWFTNARAVDLFSKNGDVLSLCIHGNDHRRHDLEQPSTRVEAVRTLSSAVGRIAAFERRTGLAVSRVMVPPHEACSEETMSAMVDLGFEAACATRPYPWVDFGAPPSPYNSPWPDHLLSGWRMTELMPNGFPVMLRRQFDEHDDAVLRRFFDQPILLYGHATEFREGLEPLERASTLINSFPGVAWKSLTEISESNFETRLDGETLRVRPFARRIRVAVEPGIGEISLEAPTWVGGFEHGVEVVTDGQCANVEENVVRLPAERVGTSTVEIRWKSGAEVDYGSIVADKVPPGVVVRRLLAEARDRIQPVGTIHHRVSRRHRRRT